MAQKLEDQHKRARMRHEMAMMKLETAQVSQTLQIMSQVPTFAQDRDERQWMIVGDARKKPRYTIQQLDSIRLSARRLQHKPAGRNILQTLQDFIIGKDATMTTEDEDKDGKLQDYWGEWAKVNNWDMKTKEVVRRLYRDGEVFLRWFMPVVPRGHLQLRFVEPNEIKDTASRFEQYGIVVDDDDYEKLIYYNRQWTMPNGTLREERIQPEDMDHWKIGVDSDEKRGVSIFQGIGKYITDYEKWIEDRIILNRIRHIWNVVGEPVSATAPLADLQSKFADVTYDTPVGQTANKKVPKPGTVLFSRGVKWKLDSLNINARDTKDDGRAIQLLIAIALQFPEYIVRGDASNANFSSTMVSESPFVRKMESEQDFVEKIFKKVWRRVIGWGIAQGQVPAKSTKTTITFNLETNEDDNKEEVAETNTDCSVNFAALIHRDEKDDTEAKQIQIGEELVSRKTASVSLGYDWESEQDQIARERQQRMDEDTEAQERFGNEEGNNDE